MKKFILAVNDDGSSSIKEEVPKDGVLKRKLYCTYISEECINNGTLMATWYQAYDLGLSFLIFLLDESRPPDDWPKPDEYLEIEVPEEHKWMFMLDPRSAMVSYAQVLIEKQR